MSDPVTAPDPRLGEIAARLAAATPGPWKTVRHDLSLYVESESGELSPINLGYVGNRPENTAEFIANAPADVAHLLAALADRDAKLARVEALAGEYDYEAERLAAKAENFIQGEVRSRYLGYAAETRMKAYLIRAAVADTTGDEE